MATKTANFNMRMNPTIKAQVEELYSGLGITLADAINMFIHQSLLVGGIPFSIRYPERKFHTETEKAIEEAKEISKGTISVKSYKTAKELFQELDKDYKK